MSPSPPRLAPSDPSHNTCNLCSAWCHQSPLWKVVPFVPYRRNITHQRGLILRFRSSSSQHNPQARQKLKHWTASPLVSAPVDKHQAHQQYGEHCWIHSITSTRFQRLHKGKPHPETVLELSGVRWILFTDSVTQRSVQVLAGFLSQAPFAPEICLSPAWSSSTCRWHKPIKATLSGISLGFARISPAISLTVHANIMFGRIQVNIWTKLSSGRTEYALALQQPSVQHVAASLS